MPYSKERLERYAMQAEKIAQELPAFAGTVEIDTVGNALGFSKEDSRSIAKYMEDIGWAKVHAFDPIGAHKNPKMTILPLGYEEIAKLRRPKWLRWIDQHPLTMNVFFMTTTAILSGIVYTIITYHLLK